MRWARCWRAARVPGERVGVLLPTSRASLVTFFALQAERRVPAMLNFSTGPASAIAACRGAEIALIVTARLFIEKAKLQALIAALEPHATIVYLEDVRGEIGVVRRLVRCCDRCAPSLGTNGTAPTIPQWCSSRRDQRARRRASCSAIATSWRTGISWHRSSTSARRTSSSTRCRCFTVSGSTGGLLHAAAGRACALSLSVAAALSHRARVRVRH